MNDAACLETTPHPLLSKRKNCLRSLRRDEVVERWSGIIKPSADIPVRQQMSVDRLFHAKIKNIATYGRSVAETRTVPRLD